MCMTCSGVPAEPVGESVEQVRARVVDRGWAVTYVEGCGAPSPSYAYTVGLSRWRHPELIMFGGRPECCVGVLDLVASRVRAGRQVREGDDLSDVLPACVEAPVVLRFPDSARYLYLANVFHDSTLYRPVLALQLYFPQGEPLLSIHSLPRPP